MSIKLTRLERNCTKNMGMEVIAAIQNKGGMNGQPTHVVTAYDWARGKYVTWQQGWMPVEVSENKTRWVECFESGNYFHTSLTDATSARMRALRDMMERAGVQPDPAKFVSKAEFDALQRAYDESRKDYDNLIDACSNAETTDHYQSEYGAQW